MVRPFIWKPFCESKIRYLHIHTVIQICVNTIRNSHKDNTFEKYQYGLATSNVEVKSLVLGTLLKISFGIRFNQLKPELTREQQN